LSKAMFLPGQIAAIALAYPVMWIYTPINGAAQAAWSAA